MDVRAGIFWDAREPLPPGVEAAVHGLRGFGASHRYGGGVGVPGVRPYHEDRPHRPQPPRQQGPRGGRDREEYAIPKPQRNNLSPLSVSVTAQVVQDTAKVTVTQLFWNDTSESIRKGAYTFPLSAGCTVTSFSCRIGRNKIVKAKLRSKPEARDAFNEALRTSRSTGLLEQATPEIFTTTLGNIPANTKLRTEITYITLLKHKFSGNRNTTILTIPTNIAPRYGSPPPELQNTLIPGLSHGISIQVDVAAEETAHEISSKSHRITIERGIGRNLYDNWAEFATTNGANDVEVSLVKLEDGSAFLDKDFVLDIAREQQNGLETPTAWLETHPTLANHKAVMLTIPPKFMLRTQSSNPGGEIIFLADRSGSMSNKMESLKSAMHFFLKGIPKGRKFNIWCFGNNHISLWKESVDYSEEALQEAMAYVSEQFSSNLGGTELLGALKAIVGERNHGLRMVDIIMLTDGEVWRLDETIDFVQDTSRSSEARIRFFALGIGNAVSHELVEGIARAGRGYAEVVPAAIQGGWEDRVVAMLGAALSGHVGPFQIEFDGQGENHDRRIHLRDGNRGQATVGPTRPSILQSPADISTLSPFLPNRAFMLFNSAREQPPLSHINIKVTAPGSEEITTRVPISLVERKDSTLHKLGARALLGDLERGQSWIHLDPYAPPRGSTQEQELVRREGEALGCKWSLVSKWTSFYAVEEPYQAAENARIPFLDAEDIQIHEAMGDLGLLRPRGAAAQQANPLAVLFPAALAAVEADDGSDEDEDSASNSDDIDMGSDGDGDSDSDDGGNDEDGGGAGGNQTGGSAEDQQRPEPDDSNANRDGGTTGGTSDTQNDAILPNASHFAAFDLGTNSSARESSHLGFFGHHGAVEDLMDFEETQSSPPEGADHTITYDSPLAPPLPRGSGQVTMQPSGSLQTTPPNGVMNSSSQFRKAHTSRFRKAHTAKQLSRPSPSPSRDRSRRETYNSRDYKDRGHYDNLVLSPSEQTSTEHREREILFFDDSAASARASSLARGQTSQSLSPDHPSLLSQPQHHSSDDTYTFNQAPNSYDSASALSPLQPSTASYLDSPQSSYPYAPTPHGTIPKAPLRHAASPGYLSTNITQPDSWDLDFESFNSPPRRSQTDTIIAPSFNMPVSAAMHSNKSRAPISGREIAGKQKIRNLLVFQSFDGSFNFDSAEQLRTHLGPDFASVVQDLQLQVDFKLAVTVGLMLLLEEKFEYCRDLWTLVYNKANDYFNSQRSLELQQNLLLESARLKVRALGMSQILQPAAPAQLVALPPAREHILTQSSSGPTERSDDMKTEPGIGRLNAMSWEESGAAVGNAGRTKRIVLDTAPIED